MEPSSEADYGLHCLKAHPLAKAVLTALLIPYKVRYSAHECALSLIPFRFSG